MPYLLLLVYLIPRVCSALTTKHNSTAYSRLGVPGAFLYSILTGIYSLFFFWALNGFKLYINSAVSLYAMVYGACVVLSLSVTVFMYNHGSMALINFISGTLSLTASAVFGALLLGEKITPELILRISLMMLCVLTVFIGTKNSNIDEEKKSLSPLTFILPAFAAIIGLVVTFLIKYYTVDPNVTDTNSLFFMTNVFCIAYALPILFVLTVIERGKGVDISDLLKACVDKRSLGAFATTGLGAVQTVITALLITSMDVATYTPVISAMGFLAMAIVTPLVRERLDKSKIIATVIALLSLFLPSLIFQ